MLDELSPVPLYHQLREILRERIDSGQWQAELPVSTEAELCHEFGVSRATVRQAMQLLVRDGLIRRRRGKGSFAASPRLTHDLLSFSSFSSYVKQRVDREVTDRLLSMTPMPATIPVAERLQI